MNTYEFGCKWLSRFQNGDTCCDSEFPTDCRALGFSMDCGQSFISAFPHTRAFQDAQGLCDVLPQVKDVFLLGSAIFSKWRWITHWEYHGDLYSPENSRWFVLALTRLMELSEPEREEGFVPVLLRLVTEPLRDGEKLEPGMRYEQELLLLRNTVRITDVFYGQEKKIHTLPWENTGEWTEKLWHSLSNQVSLPQRRDTGRWTLWGVDAEGEVRRLTGNLGILPGLSEALRQELHCWDLLVLEENGGESPLAVLTVKGKDFAFQADGEEVSGWWERQENEVRFSCPEIGDAFLHLADPNRIFAGCRDGDQGELQITAEYENGKKEQFSVCRGQIPENLAYFLRETEEKLEELGIYLTISQKVAAPSYT